MGRIGRELYFFPCHLQTLVAVGTPFSPCPAGNAPLPRGCGPGVASAPARRPLGGRPLSAVLSRAGLPGTASGLAFSTGWGGSCGTGQGERGLPGLGWARGGGSGRALVGRGPQWRGHDGEQGLIVDGPLGPRSGALTEKCWVLMPGAFAFGGY